MSNQPSLKKFESLREKFVKKWTRLSLTLMPTDRAGAERGVKMLYAAAGIPPPEQMIWCPSPSSGAALANQRMKGPEKDPSLFHLVVSNVLVDARYIFESRLEHQRFFGLQRYFSRKLEEDEAVDFILTNTTFYVQSFCGYGCNAGDWLAPYDLCLEAFGLGDELPATHVIKVAESAGWWWPFRKVCIFSERPTLIQVPTGSDKWAIGFADGSGAAIWKHVLIPLDVLTRPESITLERIGCEGNVEVRRLMIERYGATKYLLDSKAEQIHEDDFGTLYRKKIPGDEAMVMVEVANATPEKDGSFKNYYLRVPPYMHTAREAVAWTFGKDEPSEYCPVVET